MGCGVPFEEYLLHIQATDGPRLTPPRYALRPAQLTRQRNPGAKTFCYLNLLKHAKLILQVLCRRAAAAPAAAFIFSLVHFRCFFFSVFHILLFGLNYTYTERNA